MVQIQIVQSPHSNAKGHNVAKENGKMQSWLPFSIMLSCKAEPPFARSMQFNSIRPLPGFHISFLSACFACHWFFDTNFFIEVLNPLQLTSAKKYYYYYYYCIAWPVLLVVLFFLASLVSSKSLLDWPKSIPVDSYLVHTYATAWKVPFCFFKLDSL